MINRRAFLAALCALVWPSVLQSQESYPARAIHVVVGFAAGATADVAARIIGKKIGEILNQPMIIENRAGAGSMIAMDFVAHAPKDGYTLFFGTVASPINTTLAPSKSDFIRDLKPIVLLGSIPNILVVHPAIDANNVDELIRLAKSKPDALLYASAGIGSSPHLSAELFNEMAGVKMTHVPYPGSAQAVDDLLAGRVQVMFSPASTVLPFVKNGTLKALASTEANRTSAAPDLPTISESGLAGFETSVWFGLLAPTGTPPDVVAKISRAANDALRDDAIIQLLHTQGMDVIGGTPDDFGRYIERETDKWAHVIKSAGMVK
jgi:tripartite-type tricarboxylate transporter receptor subunit TctC